MRPLKKMLSGSKVDFKLNCETLRVQITLAIWLGMGFIADLKLGGLMKNSLAGGLLRMRAAGASIIANEQPVEKQHFGQAVQK